MSFPSPMANTSRSEMQQNPQLNLIIPSAHTDLYTQHHYSNPQLSAFYSHLHNPNPNPNLDCQQPYSTGGLNAVVQPPGVDPYVALPNTFSHVSSGFEMQQLGLAYAYLQTTGSGSGAAHTHYQDPNSVVGQLGLNPFGTGVTIHTTVTEKLVTANPNSTLWTNKTIGSRRSNTWKKAPKKIKVVQSAWCEVCKVDCNSKSVLDQHKLGKKHKKNLEKLIVGNTSAQAPAPASTSVPPAASTVVDNPVIGPQENPDKVKSAGVQKARKKAAEAEDLETKRRKILDGGAAAAAVRMCAVCNVVCNSETVFRYHLAGQKHAAMMKKHASSTGMVAAT